MKTCPYCAEQIKDEALKCRYCGSLLAPLPDSDKKGGDQVTYVVDRDIIRFGKFAAAVLAIFLTVGLFFFGLNLKETVDELEDAREDLETAQATLKAVQEQAESSAEQLRGIESRARVLISAIENRHAEADELLVVFQKRLSASEEAKLAQIRRRSPEAFRSVSSKQWPVGKALRVRFLSGAPATREAVERIAIEWLQFANVQLSFGDDEDAEIRIDIVEQGRGTWSFVGTDALVVSTTEPTMSLGISTLVGSDAEFRLAVLHEFGHVLGLIHENENPNANIPWDKNAVYREYSQPPASLPKHVIDRNFFLKADADSFPGYRAFDPMSIMWYVMPEHLFTRPFPQRSGPELSDSDKEFIRRLYPFG